MDKKFIIVVDDEPEIVSTVSKFLIDRKFDVRGAFNATDLFSLLETKVPDLILLDIKLPDMNGFEICKKLKSKDDFSAIPVIFLSANSAETDKVSGLDLGADDYIVKPFSLQELNARISAVLRRNNSGSNHKKININDVLKIDPVKCEVRVHTKKVNLTSAEFRILAFLSSNIGRVFTREQILDHLWGEEKIVVPRTIDVHIRHLRQKLGKSGNFIQNLRGFGYKFDTEDSSS